MTAVNRLPPSTSGTFRATKLDPEIVAATPFTCTCAAGSLSAPSTSTVVAARKLRSGGAVMVTLGRLYLVRETLA
jgi:hypothetical protein